MKMEGWNAGFLLVMIMAGANTLGRVVGGAVSDRIGRTQTMVLAFLLQAINMCLFSWYTTKGLLIGMAITLAAVAANSYYVTRQIGRLRTPPPSPP